MRTPRRSSGNRRHNKERRIFLYFIVLRRRCVMFLGSGGSARGIESYTFFSPSATLSEMRVMLVIILLFNYCHGNWKPALPKSRSLEKDFEVVICAYINHRVKTKKNFFRLFHFLIHYSPQNFFLHNISYGIWASY